jgi:hypothetical protein
VVDVVGDDGAAAGDLVADEFGGDVVGDAGAEILAVAGRGLASCSRPRFSRTATYSISGVMMPRRA